MVAGIKTAFLTVCLRCMSITLLRTARQRVSALHKMASVAYVMRCEGKCCSTHLTPAARDLLRYKSLPPSSCAGRMIGTHFQKKGRHQYPCEISHCHSLNLPGRPCF